MSDDFFPEHAETPENNHCGIESNTSGHNMQNECLLPRRSNTIKSCLFQRRRIHKWFEGKPCTFDLVNIFFEILLDFIWKDAALRQCNVFVTLPSWIIKNEEKLPKNVLCFVVNDFEAIPANHRSRIYNIVKRLKAQVNVDIVRFHMTWFILTHFLVHHHIKSLCWRIEAYHGWCSKRLHFNGISLWSFLFDLSNHIGSDRTSI